MIDYGITGKIALITGAARGLGKGIAQGLAAQGARVIITDILEQEGLKTAEEMSNNGWACRFMKLNVADVTEVEKTVAQIKEQYGQIDILVNNAGISPKKNGQKALIADMDTAEWNEVVNVNLNGVFYCARACAKHMVAQKYGRIVNMSSMAGRTYSAIPAAHYLTTKAGVIGLTRALAGELAPSGITVNAIAPGRMESEMIRTVPDEINRQYLNIIPVGRLGTAQDIADAVLFLVSDKASYITGVTLDVNGGRFIV